MEIDFRKYSLEELYDVRDSINKEHYRDRYELVVQLIEEKENSSDPSDEDKHFIEESKGFNSKSGCEKLIQYGAFAGLFLAATSIVMNIYNYYSDPDAYLLLYSIEPIIILAATLFLFQKSRTAATALFVSSLVAMADSLMPDSGGRGLIGSTLYLVIFFVTMMATFKWHSTYKNVVQ